MKHAVNFLLFITFVFMFFIFSCSSDSKTLSINPSSINFEDVYIGNSSEIEITLKNKYGEDLIIKSVNISGSPDFSISSIGTIPVSLLPNEEIEISIEFEPSTSGLIEGSLSILYGINDKEKIIPISGVGIVCARIEVSESSFDYLQRPINKKYSHDFEISNVGTDDLDLSNLSFTGSGASAYKVTPASTTIVPGSKTTITIEFEPTALQKYESDLNIEHNAVNESTPIVYSIKGEGRNSDPQITMSQSSPWDLGKVVISKSKTKVYEIENTGLDPLTITSATLQTNAEFTINSIEDSVGNPINFPQNIAVGDRVFLEIQFSPNALNTFNDTLTFVHNGTNEVSPFDVSLTGDGVLQQGFDFNGDGFSDVIVGARGDDDGGSDSGCVFIIFGSSNPSNTIDASQADVKIVGGDPGDQLNFVSDAGDFNDDGIDDIVVGADFDDDGGLDSGCAFIIFGNTSPPSTIDVSSANVKLIGGDPRDSFGTRLSCAGDFNNDGIDDIIVGAHKDDDGGLDSGCAFIFFGSKNPANTIDSSQADVILVGEGSGDRFGMRVSDAGDFNNDGIDDVIVGANQDDDGGTDSGCAFIFYGRSNPPALINASQADVKFVGEDPGDAFGYSVSYAGDFNNDGFDDVVIGAQFDDDGGTDSGCGFIFFGSNNPSALVDASNADVKLIGSGAGDRLGTTIHRAGDFNDDGYDDVIAGASFDDDNGSDSGCAFIFFGSANPTPRISASNANVKLVGNSYGDMFGHSVCFAGDFNNDGFSDVIVGAYADDDGGSNSGCAFIFFGSSNPSSSMNASAADVKLVGADASDRFYYVF